MATVNKEGGATDRRWYRHNTTHDLYDAKIGEADELVLAADTDNYTVVTSYDTASKSATVSPTTMP